MTIQAKTLNQRDAAKYIGVSTQTLVKYVQQGKLKGGERFSVSELDRFINECCGLSETTEKLNHVSESLHDEIKRVAPQILGKKNA